MIHPIAGWLLTTVGLFHLWLQGYNRYYLLIADGPLKKPLNHGWFFASFVLPSVLLLALRHVEPVERALSFAPEGFASTALFVGIAGVILLAAWRLTLWTIHRAKLRHSTRVREEGVLLPRIENAVRRLPAPFAALDTTTALEIVRRDIVVPNLPAEFDGFTIAQVSDLHFDPRSGLSGYLEEVCALVDEMKPDMVAITGDFVNSARHIPASVRLHAKLRGRHGTFAVLGNHDYWTRPDRVRRALERTHIVHLDDRRHTIVRGGRRLIVAGTDWPWNHREPDWRTLCRRGVGEALILLSHIPDNAPMAARYGANLVLSGHNHGGQCCLPLVGPIVVPSRTGHRYTAGTFDVRPACVLNVSRGVGVSTGGFRMLCPPELTILRLRAANVEATVATPEREAQLVELRTSAMGA